MDKSYLSKLSRAARWRLPPAEAREVLSDYKEMLEQDPRSEEELRRDFGGPVEAVRLLVQPKQYRRWLVVFCLMTACLLLPAFSLFTPQLWNFFTEYHRNLPSELIFLLAGLAVSLVWFRREGLREKGRPFPKKILLFLALQLIGIAWSWFVFWLATDAAYTGYAVMPAEARLITSGLLWFVVALALIGVFGLVMARLDDRRWRAVYTLGLTAAVLCMSLFSLLWGLSLDGVIADWAIRLLRQNLLLTAIGLVGTGASLC